LRSGFGVPIAALILVAALGGGGCGPVACPAALLSGQLVEVNGALAVRAPGGDLFPVDWSNYSIRRDGEDLIVTEYLFIVLAREGDFVNLGGGHVAGNGPFKVCGQVEVVPP
jgi:hypothetical protein